MRTPGEIGIRAEAMLAELAAFTDGDGNLTRLYLSPAHRAAADRVAAWMRDAGLDVGLDALGTVRGRLKPTAPGRAGNRHLLIGSHIDTVVNAGRYDGMLGVVAGVLAVEEIRARGIELPFGVDVLAFGDEEGVRFPTTLVSSSAAAGCLVPSNLDARDADGIALRDALVAFGGDPDAASSAAYARDEALAYLEVHIEQGPVLEAEGLPLGVVTSIAGQSRFSVTVAGEAGHAGTVPMALRRDALAAGAEMMLAIEEVARAGGAHQMVATVGRLAARPGAVNVIPAEVVFTLDIRADADAPRLAAIAELQTRLQAIANERGVSVAMEKFYESPTTPCAAHLQEAFAAAARDLGLAERRLASGAGHDGHALHHLTDVGMLFVRCRGGISHNPAEFAAIDDMGLAVEALIKAVERLAADAASSGDRT
ncbi:N-carbamoyl-L-amino acid hydrolase [uncultured Pleomorphomonas sp.]|uniref:N-carbamoyl-L-amino acid hydrolase n=1 Tax=uncultured Pleomorphomonas sp. TaxID=442121 RepID=A0A212KZ53_9HYPH|nr:allantoate amidohydrolase [uncultured Pleomorphomonas sp.]SCM70409.1 N-carbamoyl-L-amino acid hydrolase [uncultured Pleomorphomonas sp.]